MNSPPPRKRTYKKSKKDSRKSRYTDFPTLVYVIENSGIFPFMLICNSIYQQEIESILRSLVLDNYVLTLLEKRLRDAIEMGLREKTHAESSVKCFPTYVDELPTGKEHGKFLALDLGGTNFRVVLIDIAENK